MEQYALLDAVLLDTSAAGEDECDEGSTHSLYFKVEDIDVMLPSPEDESDEDEDLAGVDDEVHFCTFSTPLLAQVSCLFVGNPRKSSQMTCP